MPHETEYRIEAALPPILAALPIPAPTSIVAGRLAPILGLSEKEVGLALARLAPRHPNATHDGPEVMRWGHKGRRWRWHSSPQGSSRPKVDLSHITKSPRLAALLAGDDDDLYGELSD